MESLKHIFIQEATELIGQLEEALLHFEKDLSDEASVEQIFRIMHTLKGSSGMFGHDSINLFTHELESVYDSIREKTLVAGPEILELTLESLDHIKNLVSDPENQEYQKEQDRLTKKIIGLKSNSKPEGSEVQAEDEMASSTYYISFVPDKEIFINGTNVFYLLEDLLSLGKGFALPCFNPNQDFETVDVTECHTSFEVMLETTAKEHEIQDIFVFVADTSEVSVIKLDLTELPDGLEERLIKEHTYSKSIGLETIKKELGVRDSNDKKEVSDNQNNKNDAQTNVKTSRKTGPSSIRVSSEKLDGLMNQISELITTQARLSMLVNGLESAELSAITENMSKITRRLRDNAFSICLIPIDTLMIRFQRLVRDLSKGLNKKIDFITEGTDTELDKSVIEQLGDPLLHLVRNCIDHGIETTEERKKQGKPETGTIRFKAYNAGTNVVIELSDDGAGIAPEQIKKKALEKGLIGADEELSTEQVYELIFKPGFSTSEKVSDISGRGVGMDVVKRGIEDLRGEINIDSVINKGTTFTISLPLTLSIIDGLLVKIGGHVYVIPLQAVEKCYEVPTTLLTSASKQLVLDGERTPVFHMREVMGASDEAPKISQIIKMSYMGNDLGISVDSIIGEHQVVLKPLGYIYKNQEEFSGATILGDGTVALVFDKSKLVKKLMNHTTNTINHGNSNHRKPVLSDV
ncbi:MAG: chemotaxis protein CheA [Bacteroidota bacterium]